MEKVFVACSMLSEEIKKIMEELDLDNKVLYLDAALHVDLDLLEQALESKLREVGSNEKPVLLIGTKCHPDIQSLANRYKCSIVRGSNCIELLLGPKMKDLDSEAKTFYLTKGWLQNWRKIFIEGLKWDPVDARQNFGFYDRIVCIDTDIGEIAEEDILEFFEYTQVPVEIYPVNLEHLKEEMLNVLQQS